jgi:hypothetical protein
VGILQRRRRFGEPQRPSLGPKALGRRGGDGGGGKVNLTGKASEVALIGGVVAAAFDFKTGEGAVLRRLSSDKRTRGLRQRCCTRFGDRKTGARERGGLLVVIGPF